MPHPTGWETAVLTSRHPAPSDFPLPAASSTSTPDSSSTTNNHNHNIHIAGRCPCVTPDTSSLGNYRRRQSQQSSLAKFAMTSQTTTTDAPSLQRRRTDEAQSVDRLRDHLDRTFSVNSVAHDDPSDPDTDRSHTPTPPRHTPPIPAQHVPAHVFPPRSSLAAALHGAIPIGGLPPSVAMNDTPAHTAPSSPRLNANTFSHSFESALPFGIGIPFRQTSGTSTPRSRPTTLDIPGLTKSKVSPDGRIAPRDVGAKLVIVMVGLPARGKSYITKKLARYLNWLQHDTRIFNVGERRRVVAGGPLSHERSRSQHNRADRGLTVSSLDPPDVTSGVDLRDSTVVPASVPVAQIMVNGHNVDAPAGPRQSIARDFARSTNHDRGSDDERDLHRPDMGEPGSPRLARRGLDNQESMEHNAAFFDPENHTASQIREQVARETLDELLDFILYGNGSVGILDATNSTVERRKMVMDRIRERAGPDLNVLFLESRCVDQDLLEANMRLKLSGPDYKDMDPTIALKDFKKRVQAYEKAYVPLGDYEEKNHMPYIQMIDVGRKIISHQIKGFLMAQANYYLLNFNLAPRQIWITRHGLSMDNISGKIGGDSELAPEGHQYARALAKFMDQARIEWDERQLHSMQHSHFPPQPGDVSPPNPYYHFQPSKDIPDLSSSLGSAASDLTDVYEPKNFCVWTSMLQRSIQTAHYFNDEDYDTKQMRMLDELNAGVMEGLTYSCISSQFPEEYEARRRDKLHYRYPGPGGEGYLDIINRLRPVIVELERMTDHVLLVGHRSVARVLLAYFRGLGREEVADLDVPIGMLYCLEPKPYGVDFRAFRWDRAAEWFVEVPDFALQRAKDDMQ